MIFYRSAFVFAQESGIESQSPTEESLLKSLQSIEKISMDEFISKMEDISKKSQLYIKLQEEKCSGDFTSFIIDANGERRLQKIKLTKEERKLCKYSLLNFQIKVNNLTYKARVNYLKEAHKDQLEQLKLLNSKRIAELEKAAKKYK